MDSGKLTIYCLDGSSAKKFAVKIPGAHNGSAKKVKAYLFHEKEIPLECQTLFICDQESGMFEHIEGDVSLDFLKEGKNTLHMYMKKSAQTRSLENVRKSDFEAWYEQYKQNKTDPTYKALPQSSAPSPGQQRVQPAPRRMSSNTSTGSSDVFPPSPGSGQRPNVAAAATVRRPQGSIRRGNIHNHNTQSDHCLICNRVRGDRVPSTHYCYTCDTLSCVFCEQCANDIHQDKPDHEIELIDRGDPVYEEIPEDNYMYMQPMPNSRAPQPPASRAPQPPASRVRPSPAPQVQADLEEDCKWVCAACTVHNLPHRPKCTVCETDRPADFVVPEWYQPTIEEENIIAAQNAVAVEPDLVRWKCSLCTFLNLPHRPACEQCTTDRPEDYQIPPDYVPEPAEMPYVMGDVASRMQVDQILADEKREEQRQRAQNREQLILADNQPIQENDEQFECPICYTEIEPGDGVVLRECLHSFCKDCLKGHIESSENPEVRCPFMDDNYKCDEVMQEREIREIAGDFYPKLLEKSLQVAESQAADSYHCKTLNCVGWCIYEEDVNFFRCPTCGVKNCLTCQAIHENMNCKEYQDDLKLKAANDVDAKRTQDEIKRLLREGEAMNCPHCKIVIMKKTGCDWLQCSVCKTEICWVTKQARWGPGGTGDTSGGCKCRVNGKSCHPNCGNCH